MAIQTTYTQARASLATLLDQVTKTGRWLSFSDVEVRMSP